MIIRVLIDDEFAHMFGEPIISWAVDPNSPLADSAITLFLVNIIPSIAQNDPTFSFSAADINDEGDNDSSTVTNRVNTKREMMSDRLLQMYNLAVPSVFSSSLVCRNGSKAPETQPPTMKQCEDYLNERSIAADMLKKQEAILEKYLHNHEKDMPSNYRRRTNVTASSQVIHQHQLFIDNLRTMLDESYTIIDPSMSPKSLGLRAGTPLLLLSRRQPIDRSSDNFESDLKEYYAQKRSGTEEVTTSGKSQPIDTDHQDKHESKNKNSKMESNKDSVVYYGSNKFKFERPCVESRHAQYFSSNIGDSTISKQPKEITKVSRMPNTSPPSPKIKYIHSKLSKLSLFEESPSLERGDERREVSPIPSITTGIRSLGDRYLFGNNTESADKIISGASNFNEAADAPERREETKNFRNKSHPVPHRQLNAAARFFSKSDECVADGHPLVPNYLVKDTQQYNRNTNEYKSAVNSNACAQSYSIDENNKNKQGVSLVRHNKGSDSRICSSSETEDERGEFFAIVRSPTGTNRLREKMDIIQTPPLKAPVRFGYHDKGSLSGGIQTNLYFTEGDLQKNRDDIIPLRSPPSWSPVRFDSGPVTQALVTSYLYHNLITREINNNNNNNTLIYNNTPSIHDCSDGVLIAPEDYRPNSTCSITVNETFTNPYSSERTSGRAEWTVPDQTIENDPIPLEGHYEALSELSETLPPLETNDEDAAVGVRKPTYKLKNDVNSTKEIRRDNPSLHLQTDTPSGKVYEAAFPFLRGLNDNNNNSSNDNNISLEVDAVDTHLLLEPIHSASPQRSHSPNRSALYFPNPKLSDCHNRPSHSNTAPQPVVAHVRVKL